MKERLIRALAVVGAISIISMVAGLLAGVFASRRVETGTVVTVDLEEPIVEEEPSMTLRTLGEAPHLTTRDVVDGLRRAATDDRVTSVVATVGGAGMGLAQIQEIRDAVLAFRESGKRAIVFSESFGEFGPGTGAYYLASAFDEVWLQPSGTVSLTGVISETPFIRGALEKLKIEPRFDARREYKSAVNLFTERGYTPAHREATLGVLRSQFDQIVTGIGAARKLDVAAVSGLVDRAPLASDEAKDAGLVDRLGYRDEVWTALAPEGEKPPRLTLGKYLARRGHPDDDGDRVALIYGVGTVHRGESGSGFLTGEASMGSDTIVEAFEDAIDDDSIRAIVFRVDSPGGSYIASDVIWREVGRARRQGKPVIVSMGNVAGSGGYFVAASADVIVAQPGTITGSIGVLAGKLITDDFWRSLGVDWGELHEGEHATMYSPIQDYTPSEWTRFQDFLDRIYADFKTKVGEGRHLDAETVERVARGRIWTGTQALERGLVDELGGLQRALAVTRERLALAADAPIEVVVLPQEEPFAEKLLERLLASRVAAEAGPRGDLLLASLRRVPAVATVLRALDERGPLSMPWPAPVWR
jgi:protease-4